MSVRLQFYYYNKYCHTLYSAYLYLVSLIEGRYLQSHSFESFIVNKMEPAETSTLKRKASADENNNTPPKKKTQWNQKYKEDYNVKYDCILKSEKCIFYAVCGVDFNISHGGENDIKKHIKTIKHQ